LPGVRPGTGGGAAVSQFVLVSRIERKLEVRALRPRAEKAGQREQTMDLGAVLRIGQEARLAARGGDFEAGLAVRAELPNDAVRDAPVAVQLDREIEFARPHRGDEARKRRRVLRLFRHSGKAGERDEVVEVMRIACDERFRPRQADQGDARVRARGTQCAQRRNRAQHVAELQRAQDGDVFRLQGREQGFFHSGSPARDTPRFHAIAGPGTCARAAGAGPRQ